MASGGAGAGGRAHHSCHHGALDRQPGRPATREATLVDMIHNLGGRLGTSIASRGSSPPARWSSFDGAIDGAACFRAGQQGWSLSPEPPERARPLENPQIANATAPPRVLSRQALSFKVDGQGHREAIRQPSLISYPMAGAGLSRHWHSAPRGGLQRHERGRVRRGASRRSLELNRCASSSRRSSGRWCGRAGTTRCARLPPARDPVSDKELGALQAAFHLLDGEFAYAEPLRLALQQITWGLPARCRRPSSR